MLQSLHVKNLALIEETEVVFSRGLNILTGETGAGKSLLLGSINLALGAKFEKEMLRKDSDTALVELVFQCEDPKVSDKLREMDIEEQEDGTVLISRKLQIGKSTCKINGETVTARQVKELAEVLIDIHGQHEHQSLLNRKNHLTILDSFCGEDYTCAAGQVAELYRKCKKLRADYENESMDETARRREEALAQFEYSEIMAANLVPGEEEELDQKFRFMNNSKKIIEHLSECYGYAGDGRENAANSISRAIRAISPATHYESRIEELQQQLLDIESLLSDFNRDIVSMLQDCEFDEETYTATEERLGEIGRLKGKYGSSVEEILSYAEERKAYLDKLADYDAYMAGLLKELTVSEQALNEACEKLSAIRKREASILAEKLREALVNLNFLSVAFEIAVNRGQISALGFDDVEFMISTNPGEPIKSLSQVASGGELSRIMLAIKTVMAGRDEIDTLIFDEIDAGISGKTAWKVSEQLDTVAKNHQVICITHLPQIAAMADTHFCIEKTSSDEVTVTDIRMLSEEESLCELARLLGSDALTDAALQNASEMRSLAMQHKNV